MRITPLWPQENFPPILEPSFSVIILLLVSFYLRLSHSDDKVSVESKNNNKGNKMDEGNAKPATQKNVGEQTIKGCIYLSVCLCVCVT